MNMMERLQRWGDTVSAQRGFTLTEMLVVTFILVLFVALGLSAYEQVERKGMLTRCAARLRAMGQALSGYATEYHDRYPSGVPPFGFGDRHNWADLWRGAVVGGGPYFSDAAVEDPDFPGLIRGNKTLTPRLPRLLEAYVAEIELLHCPAVGPTGTWPEVGPYYYNTTSPWGVTTLPGGGTATDYGRWDPRSTPQQRIQRGAVAACVAPQLGRMSVTWRHGGQHPNDPAGSNNHLFVSGSVRTLQHPESWEDRP